MNQYQSSLYLNAFSVLIPNMIMKFHNVDIFCQICYIFDLSSALAYCMESIKFIAAASFSPVMSSYWRTLPIVPNVLHFAMACHATKGRNMPNYDIMWCKVIVMATWSKFL